MIGWHYLDAQLVAHQTAYGRRRALCGAEVLSKADERWGREQLEKLGVDEPARCTACVAALEAMGVAHKEHQARELRRELEAAGYDLLADHGDKGVIVVKRGGS